MDENYKVVPGATYGKFSPHFRVPKLRSCGDGMLCPSPVPNELAAAMRSHIAKADRLVYFAVLVCYKTDELSFACVLCCLTVDCQYTAAFYCAVVDTGPTTPHCHPSRQYCHT